MAASILKLVALIICLNTFLYLGVNYAMFSGDRLDQRPAIIRGDLFDILLEDSGQLDKNLDIYTQSLDSDTNVTFSYSFNISSEFADAPDPQSGQPDLPEEAGLSFLDGLRMVNAFFKTLWGIAIFPITLFTYNILPPIVSIIIGLPLLILNLYTLLIFMRGGGAS